MAQDAVPATEATAVDSTPMMEQVWDCITNADNLMMAGKTLLIVLVALIVGGRVIKIIQKWVRKACDRSKMETSLQNFMASLVGWILKVILFIIVATELGFDTTSFVAILGAAGLAVGLALQGTLANFAGGVLLMIFKPYKVGDLIESQGVTGHVKEIQIFCTLLLTVENKTAVMPNGAVMNNHIINYTAEGKIRVDLSVGVSYDADLQKAREVIVAAMQADPNILQDPAPTVHVAELGDNSVNLTLHPYCDPAVFWDVYFGTLESSKAALDAVGISIPFPQRDVHLYKHD